MWQEDEPVAQPESQGMPGKDDPELVDEVYIPDYVMLDFSFLEGKRANRKPPTA